MPGGDGTGPMGIGPMTGRAAGYCGGYPAPGSMNPIFGRGFGGGGRGFRGGGGGRGWRHQYYATGLPGWARAGGMPYGGASVYAGYGTPYTPPVTPFFPPTITKEQELEGLKGQAEYFEDALDGIRKRIEELEAKGA